MPGRSAAAPTAIPAIAPAAAAAATCPPVEAGSEGSTVVAAAGTAGATPPTTVAPPAEPTAVRAAATYSPHVAYRWFGSLAMAVAITASSPGGRSGRRPPSDGTGSWRCAYMSASSLSRSNGRTPVRISYVMHPRAYSSTRPSIGPPRNCSGAMYARVPMAKPGLVRPSALAPLVMPKSTR